MKSEYEVDLEIDPNALDVEWLKQPSLFFKYSDKAALARKNLDALKEEYDVYRAALDSKIRKEPEKYGLTKVTEGSIAAVITMDKTVEEFENSVNELKYQFDILTNAIRAFDQKKSALENLVKLLGMDYFSAPSSPRDLGTEWEKNAKRKVGNDKIKKGLKKHD